MKKPVSGEPVTYKMYFKQGTPKLHIVGILGGVIWSIGMMLSIMAGDVAGYRRALPFDAIVREHPGRP